MSLTGKVDSKAANVLDIDASNQLTQVTTDRLNGLIKLLENGSVKSQISSTIALDYIKEELTKPESGSIQGKVVMSIQ